jgi:hypothetical protein
MSSAIFNLIIMQVLLILLFLNVKATSQDSKKTCKLVEKPQNITPYFSLTVILFHDFATFRELDIKDCSPYEEISTGGPIYIHPSDQLILNNDLNLSGLVYLIFSDK